jgi:hypothetical protein
MKVSNLKFSLPIALGALLVCSCIESGPIGDSHFDASGEDVLNTPRSDTGMHAPNSQTPDHDGGPSVPNTTSPITPTSEGGVAIFEIRAPGVSQIDSGGVAAGFGAIRQTMNAAPIASLGPCDVLVVDTGPAPAPAATWDAGNIEVRSGTESFALVLGSVDGVQQYISNAPAERIEYFTAGQALSFVADGGAQIPAFQGSLIAPADPVITAPAWEVCAIDPSCPKHPRSSPLDLVWSGATGTGEVLVSLLPIKLIDQKPADGNSLLCVVPDTGSFQVPAEALGYLPEQRFLDATHTALTVARLVSDTFQAEASSITINVTATQTRIGIVE